MSRCSSSTTMTVNRVVRAMCVQTHGCTCVQTCCMQAHISPSIMRLRRSSTRSQPSLMASVCCMHMLVCLRVCICVCVFAGLPGMPKTVVVTPGRTVASGCEVSGDGLTFNHLITHPKVRPTLTITAKDRFGNSVRRGYIMPPATHKPHAVM